MEEIKEKLLEMQQTILDDLEEQRDKSSNAVTDDIGDDIDHATEERSRELYQIFCERDQTKLKRIKSALESIDEGTYGVCEDCGDKIGHARLMALPFTELCIECKSEEERTKGASRSSQFSEQNAGSNISSDDA